MREIDHLLMSQLEDITWEEFGDNGDHIVPHTGGRKHGNAVENGSGKRPRYELSCTESSADKKSASDNVIQRVENTSFSAVNKDEETMLEMGPWSHSSSEAFSASLDGDSNRKTSCSTSDEDRTSNQCMRTSNMDSVSGDLCADPVLGDRAAAVDNNLFCDQLNNASHTENDLGFLGNNLQDKEGSDLLYYGWPEIENFEDVDRMFRSCDSTFGLGLDNDDGLGWFSSSQDIEGSDDALKSSFNFSGCDPGAINNVCQDHEVYGMNDTNMLNNETDQKLTPVSLKRGSQKLTPSDSPSVMNSSYTNGSGAVAHIDSDSQTHSHSSQPKQQKSSEGKRKERSLENGDSLFHLDNLKQAGESNSSLDFQCSFSAETHQQQKATHQTCLQTPILLTNTSNSHPSNKVLASPRSSVIKSEDSGLPSISPRDSSYGSNQMRSVESSHVVSFQKPAVTGHKKKDKLHHRRLSGPLDKSKLIQTTDPDQVSSQKQVSNFESEVEGQSEVNGSDVGVPGEMDSSNIQESSCMSSVLEEVSIEANSFRQLQHVMEQLDIRTKLCIRDSLYRLARSAEQRHKCVSGGRDDQNASRALVSDETNKCTGFMDMETDTNPIDRSIAHLLFHRPPDPSATGALDAAPVKSYTMVQAPNNGVAEKLVSQEETTSANSEAAEQ